VTQIDTTTDQLAHRFPPEFVWGTATAAYQIEGAANEDGRGPSIWDTFSHTPGKVRDGDTGDVAADHYHRWPEDIALMRQLGVNAYRLSIAWSRVLPSGTGPVNEAGLAWYERLIDALLEAGIQPWVTLYHWDLPQALQDRGGWAAPETIDAFVAYAGIVARRLGDRVAGWITLNEPWVSAFAGHLHGRHAPGLTDLPTTLRVAHHLLLSHARGMAAIRAAVPRATVGITLNTTVGRPASDAPEDAEAARRWERHLNTWFMDPLYGRGYPADLVDFYASAMPPVTPSELGEIAAPLDFLGLNFYFPMYIHAVPAVPGRELGTRSLGADELRARGFEVTEMGWPVVPDAFRELLVGVHETYHPSVVYVTENGAAFADELQDGAVRDPRRLAYIEAHLNAAAQALEAGVPLRGYFVWSLLDNFEWAHGYSKRFGLTYVDYSTQRRVVKDSGHWYARLLTAARG
jgi:beta-glucosidase